MPELLNYSEFCENLKEVTSTKIFDKKKFNSNGLFSEQIFGPVNNYTCQCGIYYGVSKSGGKCDICGVDIISARIRRERFAKITIPIEVVNPLFYDLVIQLAGTKVKSIIDSLMKDESTILGKYGEELALFTNQNDIGENYEKYEGLEAIYELVKTISKKGYDENDEDWALVYNNLDKLLIKDIIVLPPELRPTSLKANINEVDEINRYYMQILMKKSVIEGTIVDVRRDKKLFYQYFRQLQKNINELYVQILTKLSKKEGLIRGNILGKRIDFSGRAVISPDPTISINECIVPYLMFLELFKLEISRKLIDLEKFKLLNNAIDFVDECIEMENPVLLNICKEISEEKVCLLNRQPSLHRLSMIGFNMKLSMDKVIKIHPLVCSPYNADFDGDSIYAIVELFLPSNKNKIKKVEMEKILDLNIFNYKSEKIKEDKKITKYSPVDDVKIKSINPENGETDWKKITEFSVHENLNMYKIEDSNKRFESFWSSEDHSLLVFDENDNQIKKISPKELQNNQKGKYFIQGKENGF